jgi:hypothetical protein
MSDEEFETKITGLLERCFAEDIAGDPGARAIWQQARSVLGQGDHYILVMSDQAADLKTRQWWQFWR